MAGNQELLGPSAIERATRQLLSESMPTAPEAELNRIAAEVTPELVKRGEAAAARECERLVACGPSDAK